MKKVIEIGLTILAAVFASACCVCAPEREPEGFSIPKADIVYQAINNRMGAGDESNNLIGFVNADGSGNTFLKLKERPYTPVMSKDTGGILFRWNFADPLGFEMSAGWIDFLSNSGVYKECYGVAPTGFIFPLKGSNYLLVYAQDIDLVDIKTCKVVKSLVEIPDELPWVKSVDSAYPSSSGKSMVFTETYRSPQRDVIYIMDFETGAVREVLEGGYNASFSPDDQKIAFVGDKDDGIYVANADGTDSRLIVPLDNSKYYNRLEPYPFWSPDGSSLVYHKCVVAECVGEKLSDFNIYTFNINSDVEQKIVDGGLYPVWIK